MDMPAKKQGPRKARRITPDYLHNAALYYLERYAASEGRVRRILGDKIRRSCRDHPDQVLSALLPLIETEIRTLQRVGLIDDEKLITALLSGYRDRGMPPRMIAIKLKQRGFTAALVDQMLQKQTDEDGSEDTDGNENGGAVSQERAAAIRYLQRRSLWPYLKSPATDKAAESKARQKAWAALARRGHDSDIIEQAMKKDES